MSKKTELSYGYKTAWRVFLTLCILILLAAWVLETVKRHLEQAAVYKKYELVNRPCEYTWDKPDDDFSQQNQPYIVLPIPKGCFGTIFDVPKKWGRISFYSEPHDSPYAVQFVGNDGYSHPPKLCPSEDKCYFEYPPSKRMRFQAFDDGIKIRFWPGDCRKDQVPHP